MPDLSNIDQPLLGADMEMDVPRVSRHIVAVDQLILSIGFSVTPGSAPNTLILLYSEALSDASPSVYSYIISGPSNLTVTAVSVDLPAGVIVLTYSGTIVIGTYVVNTSGAVVDNKLVSQISTYSTLMSMSSNHFNSPVN